MNEFSNHTHIDRQSNMELLRLLSMFALIFLHFVTRSLTVYSQAYPTQTGFWAHFPLLLCSITTLQVNIFVLISGYFGIHPKFSRFSNLYLQCVFYILLLYPISLCLSGNAFSIIDFGKSFLPFSCSPGWWFVTCYLFLFLLAPMFNKAIEHMSKREFICLLVALFVINSYYGFLCKNPVNSIGRNLMQLIYMYFIGRYIHVFYWALHVRVDEKKLRRWSAVLFFIGYALYSSLWIANETCFHAVKWWTFHSINNPLAVFNSVCLFLFFTTIHFQSKIVNWLASGALAVYLVHENMLVGSYWYKFIANIYDTHSSLVAWGILLCCAVALFFSVLLLDKLRQFITKPLVQAMCIVENKISQKVRLKLAQK